MNYNTQIIPTINYKAIKEVSIPSIKEWDEWSNKFSLPIRSGNAWWVREMYDKDNFHYLINTDGSVAYDIIRLEYGIRPIFIFKESYTNYYVEIGQKVLVGNVLCTLVTPSIAIADYVVDCQGFDEEVSDYEKSWLKRFLDSADFWNQIELYETFKTYNDLVYGETD